MTPRKEAKRAPAKGTRKRAKTVGLQPLIAIIEAQVAEIERLMEEMQQADEMEVSELLRLQFMVNLFSQLMGTATSITAAMHDSINTALRNIK